MPTPLNVLILEDTPSDAELLIHELKRAGLGLESRRVASEAAFVTALDSGVDIIIADYALPGFSALAALDRVRQRGLPIPVIVVSGMLSDDAAIECIKRGASEYLRKDQLKRLGYAVVRAVESQRTEAEHARDEPGDTLRQAKVQLEERLVEQAHALNQANAQLHVEIDKRRKTEEQLSQSQKMEAIGRLAGGLAHDFNNLLTGVLGSLELLARREPDEKAARLIQSATESAERGARLASQLLTFGRQQGLAVSAVDLNLLVGNIEHMIAVTLTPAIAIELVLAPDIWLAAVDSTHIELALLNLAINARDAMPAGGSLTIETRNLPANDPCVPAELKYTTSEYVVLTVADTGMGMTEDVRARAFEPFFTTKDVGKGSGLGLAMVYGLAKQLDGTVQISSAPGNGTSVSLYLPRASASAAAMADPMRPERITVSSHAPTGPARVLLVDDDDLVRDITAEALRELGYDVIEAVSGDRGLAILDSGDKIDVVVTDLVMPGMHGTVFAAEARRRQPNLPIMMITGYPGAALENTQGTRHFPVLHKPFRPVELAAMMAECQQSVAS